MTVGKQTFPPHGHLPLPDIRLRTSPPLVFGHLPLSLYIRLAGQDLSQFECDYRSTCSALLYDY